MQRRLFKQEPSTSVIAQFAVRLVVQLPNDEFHIIITGTSGRLLAGIVAEARKPGYARLMLDTLPSMKEAQSLYLSLGFKPTAPYRFNPVPGTAYLELALQQRPV
jgi:hypothetical protein